MAGKKDYFAIASRGFNHDTRFSTEKRETSGESFYSQLEKYGTPAEKAAIRNLKASGKLGSSNKSGFKINPWG
jgi:hypothetical protein